MNNTPTAELVEQRLQLVDEHDRIKNEIKKIDAELLARHKPGDPILDRDGNKAASVVKASWTFNASKAATILTDEQLAQICTAQPDKTLAQRLLPEPLYLMCCTEKRPYVKKA